MIRVCSRLLLASKTASRLFVKHVLDTPFGREALDEFEREHLSPDDMKAIQTIVRAGVARGCYCGSMARMRFEHNGYQFPDNPIVERVFDHLYDRERRRQLPPDPRSK